ncbi:J domain-containing protein-like [Limulus polyphemus]|uniref:J domain-containing protein-like n=1 Tax=Limulus polyphemus TaxID=6850 RepID=A0ABM1BSZ3_LIMPO|nr:J domain-containing protein-like [Limulus polyphemus]
MDAILQFERKEDDDFYFILGCDELSSTEQILAEYRYRAVGLHPDKNPDSTAVQQFQKLQRAKDILMDPEMRKLYDKWRRGCIAMPFEQWMNLGKSAHSSMHWVTKKRKEPMLIGGGSSNRPDDSPSTLSRPAEEHSVWKSEPPGDVLRKFRNYEI